MKNQKGFSGLEIVLSIAVAVLITGVAVFAVSQNSNQKNPSTDTTTTSEKPAKPQKSDNELITEAALAEAKKSFNADYTVTINEIRGDLASGNIGVQEGGGYAFYAKKINGTWTIIYKGQEVPGKDIGEKYNLPADWYSTEY
jgi:hypothetical protein